jgi:hypothetical protein
MNTSELQFEASKTKSYTSEHYIFHYLPDSIADKDIKQIVETQESSFAKICSTLQVNYPEKINYYFTDSPLEIGRIFWEEGTPCNGVALCGDNKIYAVYTDEIKCIGSHEDTHMISFLLGYPQSDFVVEGLAMFMDGLWWGVDNEVWSAYYKAKHLDLSIVELLDNDVFAERGCVITYPIAGAFTKFLIDTYGIERYLSFYKYDSAISEEIVQSVFNTSLHEIEKSFWEKLSSIPFDSGELEEMLRNEGF